MIRIDGSSESSSGYSTTTTNNEKIDQNFLIDSENEEENYAAIYDSFLDLGNTIQLEQQQQQQKHVSSFYGTELERSKYSLLSNSSVSSSLSSSLTSSLVDNQQCPPPSGQLLICRWHNCFKKFFNQQELVLHIEYCHIDQQRYLPDNNYICQWQDCLRSGKPFDQRYKLRSHMRTHSGEKPKKCNFPGCHRSFSRQENLKIHIRSHTNERPYLCLISGCQKTFSNSSDRAKHQRTHFDSKPWACNYFGCSKRYTDPSSLRKHKKMHHSNEPELPPPPLSSWHSNFGENLSKTWSNPPPPPPPLSSNVTISNHDYLGKTWSTSTFSHSNVPQPPPTLIEEQDFNDGSTIDLEGLYLD